MGELLRLALATVGRDVRVESEEARLRPEKSEVMELIADATLARDTLGWQPAVTLEDGVARTAEWLRGALGAYKTDRYII